MDTERLLTALQSPDCYPHPVTTVTRIETHISWILLAGDYAYKIKKPVDFGFLNFSTLKRRKHFCEEELRLNRRHAEAIYLQVDSINGAIEAPRINGDGPVLEYAVRMRRFDPEQTLDKRLQRGELAVSEIHELATTLAHLHADAETAAAEGWLGSPRQVLEPMLENFDLLHTGLTDADSGNRLTRLRDWTLAEAGRLQAVLEQRLSQGYVRECHGDAHLGNVARFEDHTCLFDCIEFNDELRWIDVLSDLAFTVMDLHDRGAPELAWSLLDTYLTETGDYAGLQVMPLYLVYRALVRAKVGVLRLRETLPAATRQATEAEVAGYLALAEQLAAPRQPQLALTLGVSGSGKSWLAQQLIPLCGLVRLRSDVERKRLAGLSATASSDSATEAGLYHPAMTERTYARLLELTRTLLKAGFSVIVDATFLEQAQRAPFLALAADFELPARLLLCEADDNTLRERILRREAAGIDPSEADLQVLEAQQAKQEDLSDTESRLTLRLDTTAADSLEQAVHHLS